MQISIISDLHLEFDEDLKFTNQTNKQVVVLAGDIHQGIAGMRWARENFQSQEIIYVAGNHEYFGYELEKCDSKLIETSEKLGIHYLNNRTVEVNGVQFIGTTLWTDFELFGNLNEALYDCKKLDDYRLIRWSEDRRRLCPSDTRALHKLAIKFLESAFLEHHERRVVVTHHPPSIRSVSEHFKKHRLTPAYASHLDKLVEKSRAQLWLHGHTHNPVDYDIAGTRVLSNPVGFPGERIRQNISLRVIEI